MSQSVDELVSGLAKKIGLKNCEEYSLLLEGSSGKSIFTGVYINHIHKEWLSQEGSVLEQLENTNQSLVLKKKYFVNDTQVDKDDPVQLHLMYIQVRIFYY